MKGSPNMKMRVLGLNPGSYTCQACTLPLSHIPRLHLQYKGYSLVAKKMGFGVRLLPGASVRNPTHNNVMREEA